jgi:hypothetical protein
MPAIVIAALLNRLKLSIGAEAQLDAAVTLLNQVV